MPRMATGRQAEPAVRAGSRGHGVGCGRRRGRDELKEGDQSVSPGCTTPAASASTASAAGRPSARSSTTAATGSTGVLPNTRSDRLLRRAASCAADFAALAPILCAGVTTYKGIKETEARPGEWLAISGVGGLGHLGIQYAKAMGLRVAPSTYARRSLRSHVRLGADLAVDAPLPDTVEHDEAHQRRSTWCPGHRRLGSSIRAGAPAWRVERAR